MSSYKNTEYKRSSRTKSIRKTKTDLLKIKTTSRRINYIGASILITFGNFRGRVGIITNSGNGYYNIQASKIFHHKDTGFSYYSLLSSSEEYLGPLRRSSFLVLSSEMIPAATILLRLLKKSTETKS